MLQRVILISILLNLVLPHIIPSRVASPARAPLVRRQGCNLEPDDPNCELPLWNDNTYNLTRIGGASIHPLDLFLVRNGFSDGCALPYPDPSLYWLLTLLQFDDLPTTTRALPAAYSSLTFANFTLARPNETMNQYLVPYNNSPNYIRLHAGYTGLITISAAAAAQYPGSLDFFKIESLALGCSLSSTSTRHEQVTGCTIEIVGMCAGPNSTSTQDVEPTTWKMIYVAGKDRKGAELEMMDMGTYGERYLCQNFTVTGMPARPGEKPPVVWLDQIEVVEYTESAIF